MSIRKRHEEHFNLINAILLCESRPSLSAYPLQGRRGAEIEQGEVHHGQVAITAQE